MHGAPVLGAGETESQRVGSKPVWEGLSHWAAGWVPFLATRRVHVPTGLRKGCAHALAPLLYSPSAQGSRLGSRLP